MPHSYGIKKKNGKKNALQTNKIFGGCSTPCDLSRKNLKKRIQPRLFLKPVHLGEGDEVEEVGEEEGRGREEERVGEEENLQNSGPV